MWVRDSGSGTKGEWVWKKTRFQYQRNFNEKPQQWDTHQFLWLCFGRLERILSRAGSSCQQRRAADTWKNNLFSSGVSCWTWTLHLVEWLNLCGHWPLQPNQICTCWCSHRKIESERILWCWLCRQTGTVLSDVDRHVSQHEATEKVWVDGGPPLHIIPSCWGRTSI